MAILRRFYVDSRVDSKPDSDGPESTDSAVDSALGSAEPVSESMPTCQQNRVSESRLVTVTSILADSALQNRLQNRCQFTYLWL